jgi:hypothetical protein
VTTIPLDQNRRDGEVAVAQAMTDLLVENCKSATGIVPQEVLAHFFGRACENLAFIPDECSARRILHAVSRELSERRRAADRLNAYILQSTEELLQIQREAKRSRR